MNNSCLPCALLKSDRYQLVMVGIVEGSAENCRNVIIMVFPSKNNLCTGFYRKQHIAASFQGFLLPLRRISPFHSPTAFYLFKLVENAFQFPQLLNNTILFTVQDLTLNPTWVNSKPDPISFIIVISCVYLGMTPGQKAGGINRKPSYFTLDGSSKNEIGRKCSPTFY